MQKFHDVGLATVYPTEDAIVMEYAAFSEFNRPNQREVASEYPPPSDELRNRAETMPSTPRKTAPTVNARELHGNLPVKSCAEVEAELEVEVEVEVEKHPPLQNRESEQPQVARTTTAEKKEKKERGETFNLIKSKLRDRHKPEPDELLMELLSEDPARDAWFDLSPGRTRSLIAEATTRFRKGEVKFRSELIVLLDRATKETRQTIKEKQPVTRPSDAVLEEYRRRKAAGEVFISD